MTPCSDDPFDGSTSLLDRADRSRLGNAGHSFQDRINHNVLSTFGGSADGMVEAIGTEEERLFECRGSESCSNWEILGRM